MRKMKSGKTLSMKYLRENLLRFHPSIFHVSAVKVREVVEGTEDGRDRVSDKLIIQKVLEQ